MSAKTSLVLLNACLVIGLTACVTSEPAKYADTAHLEKPPTLAVEKQDEEQMHAVDAHSGSVHDDNKNGMGDRVYLSDTQPPVLHIRQPFDGAWNTVGQALVQKDLKVTDQEKDKGVYYVAYDTRGFLDSLGSFFKHDDKGSIYLLTLNDEDQETTVTVTMANQYEQDATNSHKDVDKAPDQSQELLQLLYKTMREELVRKSGGGHRGHGRQH